MEQAVQRRRWEGNDRLPEPWRVSGLRICKDEDIELKTGDSIKGPYLKLGQLAPLLHFCNPD